MESYRHILRAPLLGRYQIPGDLLLPLFWILLGFLFGINLVFLLFCLALSLLAEKAWAVNAAAKARRAGRSGMEKPDAIHRAAMMKE